MSKIKVVLDTNALLVSIPKKSKYRPIFDGLINGDYNIAITTEILNEYTEIIEQRSSGIVAHNIAEMLIQLDNVDKIEVNYKWQLIERDPDDNKFVDCAISARVKYVVSNDKHFNILKKIPFPKVEVIKIQEFLSEVKKLEKE